MDGLGMIERTSKMVDAIPKEEMFVFRNIKEARVLLNAGIAETWLSYS
jgi:hypothetical protein